MASRATAPGRSPLGLAEHLCLGVVCEGTTHGWAIGSLLAPAGELGRIWSLSRPLTYRAIDGLVAAGLADRRETRATGARNRAVLRATAAGRRACSRWLDQPVAHLRDVRTELLLKLVLRQRAGLSRRPLVLAQLEASSPAIEALTAARRLRADDPVVVWRAESAEAVRRFLTALLAEPAERPVMLAGGVQANKVPPGAGRA